MWHAERSGTRREGGCCFSRGGKKNTPGDWFLGHGCIWIPGFVRVNNNSRRTRGLAFQSDQPERYSRLRNAFARLVNPNLSESHSSFTRVSFSRRLTRSPTLPSRTVSVSGPAQSKFEPAAAPPLQALIHSWKWPGDRGSFFGGSPYSRASFSGYKRHFL